MDDRASALALTPISRETRDRLDAYVALLKRWQTTTNLVAPSTLPILWTRHIADSLQLIRLAPDADRWLDIGSGGGFPGIVLACVLAERGRGRVDLVERNAKKAAFLREALRVTGGAGNLHVGDIADCAARLPTAIDIVTARAVAPLPVLLNMSALWLSKGSRGLFPKGQDIDRELKDTAISSMYKVILHRSITGNGWIADVSRTEVYYPEAGPSDPRNLENP